MHRSFSFFNEMRLDSALKLILKKIERCNETIKCFTDVLVIHQTFYTTNCPTKQKYESNIGKQQENV